MCCFTILSDAIWLFEPADLFWFFLNQFFICGSTSDENEKEYDQNDGISEGVSVEEDVLYHIFIKRWNVN